MALGLRRLGRFSETTIVAAAYYRLMLPLRRVCGAALPLLPGTLVLFFAFNAGGFYPGAPAYVAALLCVLLALRLLLASQPLAGWSWQLAVSTGSLAALAAWTLASGRWSHAPGVARVEFDLPLVYLLAMLMCGLIGRGTSRLRWMLRGLALACAMVCVCGLVTRLLPHLWPTSVSIANNRLSFPVTYWNVLGLVASLGSVLCLHLAADMREGKLVRSIATAAIPPLGTTLYFTFSRGAIVVCVIGLAMYVLLGRARGLVTALGSVVIPTGVALKVAYGANILATAHPTTEPGLAQGRHVAAVVMLCSIAAAAVAVTLTMLLDPRLKGIAIPRSWRAVTGWRLQLSVVVVLAIIGVALRDSIGREYRRFVHPVAPISSDYRARLTDPGNSARIGYWRVAWRQFTSEPVRGEGAGTYVNAFNRERPVAQSARDAHSLYLETLGELGIVGLVLLAIPILTILTQVAVRARGPRRPRYAAVLAVLLMWALHAGVDWDWEMPVVGVMFFSLGGYVLARPASDAKKLDRLGRVLPARAATTAAQRSRYAVVLRVGASAGALLLMLLPAFTWRAQGYLDEASYAFSQGDCARAISSARGSLSVLGDRAEPYEILSYCEIRTGRPDRAVTAMNRAVSLDPGNWNYSYGLALARASAGLDPRTAAQRALRQNPQEPLTQMAWRMFGIGPSSRWKADGQAMANAFTTL